MPSAENVSVLDSDNPAQKADQFGRLDFAQQVARCLILRPDQDSLVLGLEGEWGGGKSWVIEQVRRVLQEKEVLTITFNPWLVGAEEELIASCLQEMAAQVLEAANTPGFALDQGKKLAATLAGYAEKLCYLKYLKYVPGVAPLGEFFSENEEKIKKISQTTHEVSKAPVRSLHAWRGEVAEALAAFNRPLVVIIDDLDRLRQREIQAMVQLVKAVANFKGVSFLLAYDAKYIAQALSHDGHLASGSAYLEKIVQLACKLPPLVPWVYRDWLQRQCEQFLQQQQAELGRALTPFEAERLPDVIKLVARLLRHPRDVVRWLNRLRFIWPQLQGMIDAGDILLLEALHIVAPDALRTLVKQPGLLFEQYEQHFNSRYQYSGTEVDPQAWLEQVPASLDAQRALIALFPHLHHPAVSFAPDQSAHVHLRVQVYEHWLRYLNLSALPGRHDASLFLPVLRDPAQWQNLETRFDGIEEVDEFCVQIDPYLNPDVIPDMSRFALHLGQAVANNWGPDVSSAVIGRLADCLKKLLRAAAESNESLPVLEILPLSLFGNVIWGWQAWREIWLERCTDLRWQDRDDSLAVIACLRNFKGTFAARRMMRSLFAREHLQTLIRIEQSVIHGESDAWLDWIPNLKWMQGLVEHYTVGNHLHGVLAQQLDHPDFPARLQARRQSLVPALRAERLARRRA